MMRRRHRQVADYCFGFGTQRVEDVIEAAKRAVVVAGGVARDGEAEVLRQDRDVLLLRAVHRLEILQAHLTLGQLLREILLDTEIRADDEDEDGEGNENRAQRHQQTPASAEESWENFDCHSCFCLR